MQVAYAYSTAYTRAHNVTFLTDNLLNILREVIRENGLSPDKLAQDRDTLARGMRIWLHSGHLTNVIVEFYRPGTTAAEGDSMLCGFNAVSVDTVTASLSSSGTMSSRQ